MIFRRLASPLHATRASVASLYCLALGAAALITENPVVLLAVGLAVLGAAWGARVSDDVLRAARWAALLAVVVALINPLIVREGLTVLVRLGEVPPFGQVDITLEALVYGAVLGLRVLVIVSAAALFAVAVDPDALLRLFRRVSFRSALTAVLATRLVPVLIADGRRLAEGQRCRADGGGSRVAVVRAVATGALDRAVDVAATLEVRGFAVARTPPRGGPSWSRHDVAFALSTGAIVVLSVGAAVTGVASAAFYPELDLDGGANVWLLGAAIVAVALLPFADRRGIAP